MATVTITIKDGKKGKVNLTLESDPAFPGLAAEDQSTTNAQYLGLVGMQAMAKTATGENDE